MKIAALLGSSRKNGNSATLAQAFLDQAAELGAEMESFRLAKLKYQGCIGCYKCKTDKDHCVLDDDLGKVFEALAGADVWVVASPIYYGHVSGQLKCCLDRWFSFWTADYVDYMTNPNFCRLAPGKQSVWVLTQGAPEDRHGHVFEEYAGYLKTWYGFKENHLLRASATGFGGALDVTPEKVAEAKELARKIIG